VEGSSVKHLFNPALRERRGGSTDFVRGGGDASPRNSGDAKNAYWKNPPQGLEGKIRYVEGSSVVM